MVTLSTWLTAWEQWAGWLGRPEYRVGVLVRSPPSSISSLFLLKTALQFSWAAPSSMWAGVGAAHTCEEGSSQCSAIRRHSPLVSVEPVQETVARSLEDWQWGTEADHLLVCGHQTVLGWVWTDVLLLPCSATDPPPRIRIINGYITVEPQPRGHGRSSHSRADTGGAHQLSHALFLLLLILTFHVIRLHWNIGGAKLQGSYLKKQKTYVKKQK